MAGQIIIPCIDFGKQTVVFNYFYILGLNINNNYDKRINDIDDEINNKIEESLKLIFTSSTIF